MLSYKNIAKKFNSSKSKTFSSTNKFLLSTETTSVSFILFNRSKQRTVEKNTQN
jgi:hypothetical protein